LTLDWITLYTTYTHGVTENNKFKVKTHVNEEESMPIIKHSYDHILI